MEGFTEEEEDEEEEEEEEEWVGGRAGEAWWRKTEIVKEQSGRTRVKIGLVILLQRAVRVSQFSIFYRKVSI